jgi:hypothetical protein
MWLSRDVGATKHGAGQGLHRRLAPVFLLLVLVPAALLGAASAHAQRWSIQPLLKPRERGVALVGVSCPSARVCIAVGRPVHVSRGRLFAERWDGDEWSLQRAPIPHGAKKSGFNGVSCVSVSACVAVGYFDRKPLAERWNGRRWSLQRVPSVARSHAAALFGVSCLTASDCFAAGRRTDRIGNVDPLVERWNGVTWQLSGSVPQAYQGDLSELLGVSCSSRFACAAVGDSVIGAIAEQWDGMRWTAHPQVNPSVGGGISALFTASCVSRRFCAAVGFGNNTSTGAGPFSDYALMEVWNGRRWRISTKSSRRRNNYDLSGVSCTSATACLAVGNVAEHWNGRRWSLQRIPSRLNHLIGVDCRSRTNCEAVGSATRHGREVPLAVQWSDGTA